MKQEPVMEALEAANSALQGELENRGKLKEEMQATEPEIREAIHISEKAQSLAQEVQEKQVSAQVWKSRSRTAEALSETQAVLELELEKRGELERAMEETRHAIVDGIEKSGQARERLELEGDLPSGSERNNEPESNSA